MVDHKVHPGAVAKEWKKFLTAQKVVDMAVDVSPEHTPLQAEDVIVSFSFMDYGMKDRNPLDFVRFYNKTDPNGTFFFLTQMVAVKAHPFEVSSLSGRGEGSQLVPEQWQELTIRCFTRDPEYVSSVPCGLICFEPNSTRTGNRIVSRLRSGQP